MAELRNTFAYVQAVEHRLKAAAALLSVSENTLRTMLQESGIEVKRANQNNPDAPAVRLFDLPTIFALAEWRASKKPSKLQGIKKPIVIAVEIIKGGTAKSTTAAETAVQLQLQGYKVLLIDIDIQANVTQLMGYEADLEDSEAESNGLSQEAIVNGTFANICSPFLVASGQRTKQQVEPVDASKIIKHPFGPSGPALIPSDTFFSDLEVAIANSGGPRELFFQRFFQVSESGGVPGLNVSDYDIIIFDCPPSVSFVATNAIAAADIIIAPVKMESFSVKGLSKLVSEMNTLHSVYPNNVTGTELIILPTFYSTNLKRVGRMQERLAQYRDRLAPCYIMSSEEFPASIEQYLPLTLVKPTSGPVKEYRMFVDHLEKTIEAVAKKKSLSAKKAA